MLAKPCSLQAERIPPQRGGGLVHSWKEDANEGSEEEQAGRGKIEPGTQAFFAFAFTQTDLETHIEDGPGDHRQQ